MKTTIKKKIIKINAFFCEQGPTCSIDAAERYTCPMMRAKHFGQNLECGWTMNKIYRRDGANGKQTGYTIPADGCPVHK